MRPSGGAGVAEAVAVVLRNAATRAPPVCSKSHLATRRRTPRPSNRARQKHAPPSVLQGRGCFSTSFDVKKHPRSLEPAMSTPAPRTYFNTQLMEPRLRRLFGIGVEDLQSVGAAAVRAFVAVSALHPKGFNGTSAWAE